MALSRRLRFEILRRDNHACRYCGACAPDVKLTVDHVIPVALGGSDDPTNLVAACRECNAGKSATNPDAALVADVRADALRWAQAMQVAEVISGGWLDALNRTIEDVDGLWCEWTDWHDDRFERPAEWQSSVEQFMRQRVGLDEWRYAIRKAMESQAGAHDKWRYTCGVLWKRIKERTEIALDAVDALDFGDGA